jgi:hypothetical protein
LTDDRQKQMIVAYILKTYSDIEISSFLTVIILVSVSQNGRFSLQNCQPLRQKVNSLLLLTIFHFKLADKCPTLTFAAEIEKGLI